MASLKAHTVQLNDVCTGCLTVTTFSPSVGVQLVLFQLLFRTFTDVPAISQLTTVPLCIHQHQECSYYYTLLSTLTGSDDPGSLAYDTSCKPWLEYLAKCFLIMCQSFILASRFGLLNFYYSVTLQIQLLSHT